MGRRGPITKGSFLQRSAIFSQFKLSILWKCWWKGNFNLSIRGWVYMLMDPPQSITVFRNKKPSVSPALPFAASFYIRGVSRRISRKKEISSYSGSQRRIWKCSWKCSLHLWLWDRISIVHTVNYFARESGEDRVTSQRKDLPRKYSGAYGVL